MTSVQLSASGLGAARERVPQHARRRSACRSLFGAVDHDELNRDMEARLRELSERDQKRWNFDFAAGTPLLGEYEWEAAAAEATPAFYQETVQAGKKRAAAAAVGTVTPRTETPHRESASAGQPSCTRAKARRRRKTGARAATAPARIPGSKERENCARASLKSPSAPSPPSKRRGNDFGEGFLQLKNETPQVMRITSEGASPSRKQHDDDDDDDDDGQSTLPQLLVHIFMLYSVEDEENC
ncbi:hypothetical protein PDJAM_G00256360 [Pangasius djambal]|uniref:Uncharacterized protein n=1 Tax=Pangasius djambal TaxID=1691987 RepID=A0ACC5YKT0_9TELE|nr:hypothetical protein [Pangasius djambal]